jgi:hypothetical protein
MFFARYVIVALLAGVFEGRLLYILKGIGLLL